MATIQLPTYKESKLMDFLAVAIMLLFTALLFLNYGVPSLHETFNSQALGASGGVDMTQ